MNQKHDRRGSVGGEHPNADTERTATKTSWIIDILLNQSVLFLLAAFLIFMAIMKPSFLAWWNIRNILLDVSIYGVVAIGMTILIISGEFDLSASSQYMWAQILFITLLNALGSPIIAIVLTLISGFILGTLNGLIVTRLKVNSFITTLGTMTIIRGWCLVFTGGKMVNTNHEFVRWLGSAKMFGLSSIIYIFLAVLIVVSVMLLATNFGRRLYAVGGNFEVAKMAGIKVHFQKTAGFSIMGILCAIAGIQLVLQLRAGSTQYGKDLALTSVAATVLGGTRLSGGAGNALRTVLGMLVIVILYKALIYLGLQSYYQNLTKGLVLIAVVLLDYFMTKKRGR